VKFINTDGMAFIGPGSEWFWTAVSGIVLAVTFYAIYRQLRLQRSQGAIEQVGRFEAEYASERFQRLHLELLLALRDGVDPANLPMNAAFEIANFWEGVGSLARHGHLDLQLLLDSGSVVYCQSDWVLLAPLLTKIRRERESPALGEQFVWLVGKAEAWARKAGLRLEDATHQAARLEERIANFEAAIRTAEALRAVTMVFPSVAPAAPSVPVPVADLSPAPAAEG
jgi:hypothetical protein